MTRNKVVVSVSLSKEVADKLKFFQNKSSFLNNLLSYLLLDLSTEEIVRLIDESSAGKNPVELLLERKGIKGQIVEPAKQETITKPDVNETDWWG